MSQRRASSYRNLKGRDWHSYSTEEGSSHRDVDTNTFPRRAGQGLQLLLFLLTKIMQQGARNMCRLSTWPGLPKDFILGRQELRCETPGALLMGVPFHQTAQASSHLHTAGRERLSRALLNVLASNSDSPVKTSFFMDCRRTLGKNPLEAKASFYYYPIPIANMLSLPRGLTTWLVFKSLLRKFLPRASQATMQDKQVFSSLLF